MDWTFVCQQLAQATNTPTHFQAILPVGGGCINQCYRLQTDRGDFFVKINDVENLAMFEAETAGLKAIAHSQTIRTPNPIVSGQSSGQSFLVMEYISLDGPKNEVLAGRQLAEMHESSGEQFGWTSSNHIGLTPQPNGWQEDWRAFWKINRLRHQLQLAATNGYQGQIQAKGEELLNQVDGLLNHNPQPSLLHGDLWGGNIGYDSMGAPVIFDPATYYGDRETDLAMTHLFGGFSDRFYAAYHEAWPLEAGYQQRRLVYNLYHILNHLNLFGGSYLRQAEFIIDQLLAETRG